MNLFPQACSYVLLKSKDKADILDQVKKLDSYLKKKDIYKRVNELCKKMSKCENCNYVNGSVKKAASLKIVHERFKNVKKGDLEYQKYMGKNIINNSC